MAVASLVLGIIGLVVSLFTTWPGAILGLIAIILGALGRKDPAKKGIATAGLVLGILAMVFGLAMLLICGSCLAAAGTAGAMSW